MDTSGNKLLPILGVVLILACVVIGMRSCGRSAEEKQADTAAETPKPLAPDADSPADTLRALTVQVADMKLEAARLQRSNEEASVHKEAMTREIVNQVRDDITREVQAQQTQTQATMLGRIEDLAGKLQNATNGNPQVGSEGPVGPGAVLEPTHGDSFRVEPLNSGNKTLFEKISGSAATLKDKATETLDKFSGDSGGLLRDVSQNSILASHGAGSVPAAAGSAPILPEPVYTVPRNATLLGSTGFTALIGRIPIKGNVDDPYPFKVIVGSDNLAANGLDIPGLDGMIFSGTAFGDWALSCVRGAVHSVTFVFEDGTIRTLSSDDQSLTNKSRDSALAVGQTGTTQAGAPANNGSNPGGPGGGGGSQSIPAIGYLSDTRGIPCITGQRISNATEYLAGRFLARAVGAAGQAYARSQTTVTSSPLTGGVTSSVTGDPTQFALGSIASGGSDELAEFIRDRQGLNYDVVFVDTGADVAIHIDRELPIDFEPNGRKLTYARVRKPSSTRLAGLD